jgi:hypothetical protein
MGTPNVRNRRVGKLRRRAAALGRNERPSAERRRAPRILAGRTGWIAFRKGARLRECFVGDESDSGAQLTVIEAGNLPHVFYLYFSAHFAWRRYCRMTWRSGDKVGIEFLL